MKSLMLAGTLSVSASGGYTAAVTFVLLAMLFCSLLLMGRDLSLYRETREKILKTNALLWGCGAAMSLGTLLFILLRKGWLMGLVFLVGLTVVYRSVGLGIRDQLRNY